jgi:hypothetical protein
MGERRFLAQLHPRNSYLIGKQESLLRGDSFLSFSIALLSTPDSAQETLKSTTVQSSYAKIDISSQALSVLSQPRIFTEYFQSRDDTHIPDLSRNSL